MKIEINDQIIKKCNLTRKEVAEILAVAIYKKKKIHGSLAGKILGISELEFHKLLEKYDENINYDPIDLLEDIKNNKL